MEINNIVSNSLSSAFPRQTITFTNKKVQWVQGQREPIETTEELTLSECRLQTLSPAEIYKLGFDVQQYEYFALYISNLTLSQVDKLKQLGATTFIYDNQKYQIVGVNKWDSNNWRKCYCYKIEQIKEQNGTTSI